MNQEIYLIFLSAYALTGIVVLPKNISGLSFPTPSGRVTALQCFITS